MTRAVKKALSRRSKTKARKRDRAGRWRDTQGTQEGHPRDIEGTPKDVRSCELNHTRNRWGTTAPATGYGGVAGRAFGRGRGRGAGEGGRVSVVERTG